MVIKIRNWLIRLLGGVPIKPERAESATLVEDVFFRELLAESADDDGLFERSLTQWHFGDWSSLNHLQRDSFQNHPMRVKLALLAAAGRLQAGSFDEGAEYVQLAQKWGASKSLVAKILIAGVHNSLGRAAAYAGNQTQSIAHFERSVTVGHMGGDLKLLTAARVGEQCAQLGLTTMQKVGHFNNPEKHPPMPVAGKEAEAHNQR